MLAAAAAAAAETCYLFRKNVRLWLEEDSFGVDYIVNMTKSSGEQRRRYVNFDDMLPSFFFNVC